jgi:hypothetical protein
LGALGQPLRTERAPRGGISLQLAATPSEGQAIHEEWTQKGVVPVAKAVLAKDTFFILAYVAGWSLLAVWATWWGAGAGWHFLKNLLLTLADEADWCYVIVKMPPVGQRHKVALDDRLAFLQQYRRIGFREQRLGHANAGDPATGGALDAVLCQELGFQKTDDTLLSLDLKQWKQRQEMG